ncbi:nucleotidyltransferase family protein [Halopiger thermotolerans]
MERDETDTADATGVAGVLLAAGTSSRFEGGNKLLATVDGTPIVRRAAATLVDAPVDPVVAVVGHEGDAVRDALEGLAVEVVDNPDYRAGQSTSVRRGIDAISDQAAAAVISLGDMPSVDSDSVAALVDAYRAAAGDALAAAYDGERGNPVLFDADYFGDLTDLEGDVGGREILRCDGTLVETGDPGVRADVDRRTDLPDR